MNTLEFGFADFNGFALQSSSGYESPAMARRLQDLAADLAANPPPVAKLVVPPAPLPRPVFHLSPAELAKIERNCERLSHFSDQTSAMF